MALAIQQSIASILLNPSLRYTLKFNYRVALKSSKSYGSTITTIDISPVEVVLAEGLCEFIAL